MRRSAPAILCLLLLIGCGSRAAGPAAERSECAGDALPLPITEEALRAVYAEEQQEILRITAYEGDFLVETGPESRPALDWVFGSTGIRRRLYVGFSGIRDYEILYAGCVRFTTEGILFDSAYRDFPQSGTVSFSDAWDQDGALVSYDVYHSGETAALETYWAPLDEPASFGMEGRSEAVLDARVTVTGLEILFGPMSGQDFDAALCAPPLTEIACSGNAMTITCHDTYLDCMALTQGETPEDLERLQMTGTLYPGCFPTGPLPNGSNRFLSQAEIAQDGSNVVVRLTLTESAGRYAVETTYLGPDDNGPGIRLSLAGGDAW